MHLNKKNWTVRHSSSIIKEYAQEKLILSMQKTEMILLKDALEKTSNYKVKMPGTNENKRQILGVFVYRFVRDDA